MAGPTISFCTYTFNDAEFAEDLVRETRFYTVQPDEIIVVDDGSDVPFAMKNPPSNLRIIRFERNRGVTAAKGAGLTAASGDVVFSMDCDTRVRFDWLERNLPNINVPEIGIVGGSLGYTSGDDLVSRYMAVFGDAHNLHHIGAVKFISGSAFLIRREVWDLSGGFNGFGEPDCQDHYLCERLSTLGYTLFSDARAEAWQVRRMARTTMCKRSWKLCHQPIKQHALEADDVVGYFQEAFVTPMLNRCDNSAVLGEPLFYYLELLYLAHGVLDTLQHLIAHGRVPERMRGGFLAELVELFGGYPRIQAMFRADIYAMGHDLLAGIPVGDGNQWQDFFLFAPMMRKSGLFHWMEDHGVTLLVRDEVEMESHMSLGLSNSYEAKSA